MTIDELLRALTGAFPAFNAKALESWAPVFRARFTRHEGPTLKQAYVETLAAFSVAKSKALFPVPVDFEQHLPSNHPKVPEDGGSIRDALAQHAERKRRLFDAWTREQGARIKENRPFPVYAACIQAAMRACGQANTRTQRKALSAEQIAKCEQQALSAARVGMFGALPHTNEEWTAQIEQVRAGWAATDHSAQQRTAAA